MQQRLHKKRVDDEAAALAAAAQAAAEERAKRALLEENRTRKPRAGQDKRAKFPTSKAPISAVFHSFRLTFGRAIISRNGLEAWMLIPERARAEHSR